MEESISCGPGGIVWSFDNVATIHEIVDHFGALEDLSGNWGTSRDNSKWDVTNETYINGVMMELDFDYRMGWLIQAVDRESGWCTYVAVVHYHGRRPDGTFERDFLAYDRGHKFFEAPDGFQEDVMVWAVRTILQMVRTHDEVTYRHLHED
jgi:hypothetical protein